MFRRFIQSFADIVALLCKTIEKDQPRLFDPPDEKECFVIGVIEIGLIGPPVLSISKSEEKYTLHTDASDKQIWWVILQKQKASGNRPIEYWSHTVGDNE